MKTKYSLFHPASTKNNKKKIFKRTTTVLLKRDSAIKKENVTKFLGVLNGENLSWKQHINDIST